MKSMIAIVAGSLIVATPALAEPLAPKPVTEAAAQDAMPAAKSPTQRVCVVDTITGSRIPYKECRTRAEWQRMGVDLAGI